MLQCVTKLFVCLVLTMPTSSQAFMRMRKIEDKKDTQNSKAKVKPKSKQKQQKYEKNSKAVKQDDNVILKCIILICTYNSKTFYLCNLILFTHTCPT